MRSTIPSCTNDATGPQTPRYAPRGALLEIGAVNHRRQVGYIVGTSNNLGGQGRFAYGSREGIGGISAAISH